MRKFTIVTGSWVIVALIGWAILSDGPLRSSRSYVRAQVQELENPEGKVIPFGKDGIEVLTHGPVHEAFAQPGTGKLAAAIVVRKQPPQPLPELPPEQKPDGANVMWIPGYWAWDDERTDFLWVSGSWRATPPGREWVAGYWDEADGGWRWVSGYWRTHGETAVNLVPEPPEPVAEAPPPEQIGAAYVPGVWVYREQRYWWRPGFWLPNRPGWTWAPASYYWTPAGYCFVDGYWDYDWHRRGLLFAPVFVDRRYQSGWYYRPYFAVQTDSFFLALFVRPSWNHYYFGDYYDPSYVRLGFTPWLEFRIGGRWHDPAWSYYRWRYRDDPRWEQNLRTTYVTRRQDAATRPARTLAEQERRVGGVSATAPLVTSLNKLPATSGVKLQPVSKTEALQVRKTALQVQSLGQERAKIETAAKAKIGSGQPPGAVQLELPKSKGAAPRAMDGPPPPTLPKLKTSPAPGQPGIPPKVDKKPAEVKPPPKSPPPKSKKDKDKGDNPRSEVAVPARWDATSWSAAILRRPTPSERGAVFP